MDFAGGTVVHINAGVAGLVLRLVIGKRIGWPKDPMRPHNLPFVMLGAGLLWFGWYGFNVGSRARPPTAAAGYALPQHHGRHRGGDARLADRGADPRRPGHHARRRVRARRRSGRDHAGLRLRRRRSARSCIGVVAGALCALAVGLKFSFGFDDSLDVVGVHLVGGIVGAVLIGFFGQTPSTHSAAIDGLFYGGGLDPARHQARRRRSPSWSTRSC